MDGFRGLLDIPTTAAEAVKDESKITSNGLLLLLEKQGFKCALTGRDLTPQTSSLDHKIPISKGGSNRMGNIWIVHIDANMAKGTMTLDEFVQLCREVVALYRAEKD